MTLSVLDPITPAEGVEALDALVGGGLSQVGVTRLRLDRAMSAVPEFRDLGYFTDLVDDVTARTAEPETTVNGKTVDGMGAAAVPVVDWSQLSTEDARAQLGVGLQAMLARELRTPPSTVDVDQPFPELGLDSMMAMTVLRDAQQFVGVELSATMFWDHPTISSLAACLADIVAPRQEPVGDDADLTLNSGSSVLDALFDSVESATAGSESGM